MKFLKPARDPEWLLEQLAFPNQPPHQRQWQPGFSHYMEKMPVIDASQLQQDEEVARTRELMDLMSQEVAARIDELRLPTIGKGEFGRLILGIEEPTGVNLDTGKPIPGTEYVLAIWGEGFTSPVHGHAPGYIHEQLVRGAFDVRLYDQIPGGTDDDRLVVLTKKLRVATPQIFYSEYVPEDLRQRTRFALIHNFTATTPEGDAHHPTLSTHYLPEHVLNGNGNRWTVLDLP
ncbi:hypothetical protein COW95_04070 [Candidatus Peregrinibacteria bacterium CG22_combo_CG10-13_8_21_14_all_49_11]|nr:MAG: hypothetical protein COW95_04070 [Candidatus Peregrinibacteria bacterium CG22_combo_CG10-13_8_21_14_all_49_11]